MDRTVFPSVRPPIFDITLVFVCLIDNDDGAVSRKLTSLEAKKSRFLGNARTNIDQSLAHYCFRFI